MRNFLITEVMGLVLLLLVFSVYGVSQSGWIQVETFDYDWSKDGKAERFILEIQDDWDAGGEFTRLRISTDGPKEFVIESSAGWTKFSEGISDKLDSVNNLVGSQYLLFLPFQPGEPPLLFIFGWPYGSSYGTLHVIGLIDGRPQILLEKDGYFITEYTDLDGDGLPELVGWPCMEEVWGPGFRSYNPYQVYKLPKNKGSALLSLPLSKKYNAEHYVGWAGPECTNKLVVVTPPGGDKPVIMKRKDAEKLFYRGRPKK
ncbi:MAG: hypothetical protein V3R29_12500 [Candidatus Acidoferrales bacterium]